MAIRVGVYTLRIMRVDDVEEDLNQRVIDGIGDLLTDVEGQISNQLPEGFYCKIEDH